MNIAALKDFAIIVGGLVTIFAFANGLLEYRRQGAQKRVEHFTLLRRRLKENPIFKEICALMFADDPRLSDVNAQDKGGLIALHNASSYGHLEIAALLIKYNTQINAVDKW